MLTSSGCSGNSKVWIAFAKECLRVGRQICGDPDLDAAAQRHGGYSADGNDQLATTDNREGETSARRTCQVEYLIAKPHAER